MFKSWTKSRDIITLFHKPASQASVRVMNLLKQSSAQASESATEDQASDHSHQDQVNRSEFDIDITENLPTKDQLTSILEYIGKSNAGKVVKGASGQADALKKFGDNSDNFVRPLIVDWNNGKAVAGEDESEILKLLKTAPGK